MEEDPLVWLIGMMGSGKSRVGRILASRTNADFIDTDSEIIRLSGSSISEIFDLVGEERFRDLEERVVVGAAGPWRVIATGGGAVLRPTNVEFMRSKGTVVWLRAELNTLAERVGHGNGRPLLSGKGAVDDTMADISEARLALYAAAAHHSVDTEGLSPESVAEIVENLWLGS